MEQKQLDIGDPVEIINYGTKITISKQKWDDLFRRGMVSKKIPENLLSDRDGIYTYDSCPEMVGQTGQISKFDASNIEVKYSVRGVSPKSGPYRIEQLKRI